MARMARNTLAEFIVLELIDTFDAKTRLPMIPKLV